MMTEVNSTQLARISNAINRIEAAAKMISSRPHTSNDQQDDALRQKNSALKNETKAAIAALDVVIAQLAGDN